MNPTAILVRLAVAFCAVQTFISASCTHGAILDKHKLLQRQSFWDNRDWDWYAESIPFLETPDAEIDTIYFYRWELLTKHLTYGSPNSGYSFTEFIDRPFWSGAYGAISCPAGHQFYEARWLRSPRIPQHSSRYWFRTPGAQPRRYSTWLADAVWAVHQVHPDKAFAVDLLPDLIKNYQGWEQTHFVPEVGLFWQNGHDDGMEYNITSRQTKDIVRGANGYRPTLNSYLWADAMAISKVADLAGDRKTSEEYRAKAASIKINFQKLCWDQQRQFFFHVFKDDESADGHSVKALTKTYETGQFAGSPHGREQIGFVPWQFNLPDQGRGYEASWKFLMQPEYFAAPFGPTTVEQQDPQFVLKKTCCWWSGMSWPYATTQTLKGMANLLQSYQQDVVSRDDYFKLLKTYTATHRKNGRPYIAEAANPFTGSWEGHDSYNHSEHYFHSGYVDLIVTGLAGLKPRDDDTIEIDPLAPSDWPYFALDDLQYRGRRISILWDATGKQYNQGQGLYILADGKKIASSQRLGPLTAKLPAIAKVAAEKHSVNFAVNNDGNYFPRVTASHTAPGTTTSKLIDGNYWYHVHPPNRWTSEGSESARDLITLDFGTQRPIHTVKAYFLDDADPVAPESSPRAKIAAPMEYEIEYLDNKTWRSVPMQARSPERPIGHRANVVRFPELRMQQLRLSITHATGKRSGLTELEAWGSADGPIDSAPMPEGNLAFNPGDQDFPKASSSYTSRHDQVAEANDGRVNFSPEPRNRWTAYESPNKSDWLEIDFGATTRVSRVELAFYDDRGGVQAPADYSIEFWDGQAWRENKNQTRSPEKPVGGQFNEVSFTPVDAIKLRVICTHRENARTGLTEIFVWEQ